MKSFRCLLTALLLLVFGAGAAVLPAQGDEAIQSTIQTTVDQMPANGCLKCNGGDMALAAGSCVAIGACALGVVFATAVFMPRAESVGYVYTGERHAGFQGSPEPFPPKHYILL